MVHDLVIFTTPKWLKKKMISCEEVSKILTSNQKMGFFKKVQLKMHVLICQHCTDYKHQMIFINKSAKKIPLTLIKTNSNQIERSKEEVLKRLRVK